MSPTSRPRLTRPPVRACRWPISVPGAQPRGPFLTTAPGAPLGVTLSDRWHAGRWGCSPERRGLAQDPTAKPDRGTQVVSSLSIRLGEQGKVLVSLASRLFCFMERRKDQRAGRGEGAGGGEEKRGRARAGTLCIGALRQAAHLSREVGTSFPDPGERAGGQPGRTRARDRPPGRGLVCGEGPGPRAAPG